MLILVSTSHTPYRDEVDGKVYHSYAAQANCTTFDDDIRNNDMPTLLVTKKNGEYSFGGKCVRKQMNERKKGVTPTVHYEIDENDFIKKVKTLSVEEREELKERTTAYNKLAFLMEHGLEVSKGDVREGIFRVTCTGSSTNKIEIKTATMSKKSMIALIEAWEDCKDQYDTMKAFIDAYYNEHKKKPSSKKKKEETDGEESETGSNNPDVESKTHTPRIKVTIKAPKEKKIRREKIVMEIGDDEKSKKTNGKQSKYMDFLKQWRVDNPTIKGKEAIKQGAAAWREFKTTIDV